MNRRSSLTLLTAAGGAAFAWWFFRMRSAGFDTQDVSGEGMMGGGMMGGGMMSPRNGPMRTGMELFDAHALVRRSVTEIPGGIRAVSESDDPHTAALLQRHVSDMYARLDQNRAFAYPMSRSVPAMFANAKSYRRKLMLLPKGIAVVETSDDADMVKVIREHAREITGFVNEGMPAMMHDTMG